MSSSPVNRRDFARRLAAASGAAAMWSVSLPAEERPEPQGATAIPSRASAEVQPIGDSESPPVSPAAELPAAEDLLLAALIQRYPSAHFTPERLSGIRSGLRRNLVQFETLRRVPLNNSDAPAVVFHAYRDEESGSN